MRKSKRAIVKSKVYGFNPWADQVLAINQIMEETGQRSEAPLVRDLVDEALAARRRTGGPVQVSEPPAPSQGPETLNTIETLLLRMIAEEERVGRMHGVTLALVQETLAETRSGRRISWTNLVVPLLREKGLNAEEIEKKFEVQTEDARNFAYGLAAQIKMNEEQVGEETEALPTQSLLF